MDYLKYIPKTLRQDFIDNRVIPFVGSGFSKNAIVPKGVEILDWNGLGKAIANYMPKDEYEYTNPIEALSMFEAKYSRTKLIEIMARELNINNMQPGDAHKAFCALNFKEICTTNFDCLLEQTLTNTSTPHSVVTSESRLAINTKEVTKLIKIHGDFNNPDNMVITENDYDTYLDKNKIMSTYISNLFITKTLLLIGYSFDDSDTRTLWKMIGTRLGKLQNPAYVVLVNPKQQDVIKFKQRNIEVISLEGETKDYGKILKDFFETIHKLISDEMPEKIVWSSEAAKEEIKMPTKEKKLCYISTLSDRLSIIKDGVSPILKENMITPISIYDAIGSEDNIAHKVEALINQASMSIFDVTNISSFGLWEYNLLSTKEGKEIFLIKDKNDKHPILPCFASKKVYEYSIDDLESCANHILVDYLTATESNKNVSEFERLLELKEYSAAVISAYRTLEVYLQNALGSSDLRGASLASILKRLVSKEEKYTEAISTTKKGVVLRNNVVHRGEDAKKSEAEMIARAVKDICKGVHDKDIVDVGPAQSKKPPLYYVSLWDTINPGAIS